MRLCARRLELEEPHRIYFVHEGRASYPELLAYRKYFAGRFATEEISASRARLDNGVESAICWHMMGFYPRRIRARLVIHDYRSLSVGRARKLKDKVKSLLNYRPGLRIYQNDSIRAALGFDDGVPWLLLPMGVPDDIMAYRVGGPVSGSGDCCYVGSLLRERRIDRMIASFLRRYGGTKTLWLYGLPDDDLRRAFRDHTNIVFAGFLPQAKLLEELKKFKACVCYFPNHYPHLLQTPTKLLEYAALGLRIIANEHPRSRMAEREFGLACRWGPAEDIFAGAPDTIDWPDNSALDPSPLLWQAVIRKSGIDAALAPYV